MEDVVRSMNEKSDNQLWILFVMILFVIGVWLGSYWYIENHYPIYDVKGQVGDMFGAINALFSGLAFAGLIYAIYLQNKELKLQKEELWKTQEIAEEQEKALRSQAESQNLAVFQASFTQMLEIHFRLMDSYSKNEINGSQHFNASLVNACELGLNEMESYVMERWDARLLNHLHHIANIVGLVLIEFPNDIKRQDLYISRLVCSLSYYLCLFITKASGLEYYKGIQSELELLSVYIERHISI